MGGPRIELNSGEKYPVPVECRRKQLELLGCPEMFITISNAGLDFPEREQHAHDSYEFLIPSTPMPDISVENKILFGETNTLIPFNSGQAHGPDEPIFDVRFTAFIIDEKFFNNIAHSIYGKKRVFFKNSNYIPNDNLQVLLRLFTEEARNGQPGQQFALQGICTQIAVNLLRSIDNDMPSSSEKLYGTDKKNIKKAVEFLTENYNREYSIDEVADIAKLSSYHFIRVFKAYTGKPPYEYLLDVKIEKARQFLALQRLSVTEVCFMSGFNNVSHFTTLFKKRTGMTPSDYRREVLGA